VEEKAFALDDRAGVAADKHIPLIFGANENIIWKVARAGMLIASV
jgi:hypothetical protein